MTASASGVQKNDALFAAVVGMLVLDGYTDPSSASFDNGFWSVRGESAESTTATDPTGKQIEVPNKHVYQEVAAKIKDFPGHAGVVFYQELAAVSRRLLANTDAVPVDSPGFEPDPRRRRRLHDERPAGRRHLRPAGPHGRRRSVAGRHPAGQHPGGRRDLRVVPARAAPAVRGRRPDRGDVVERAAPDRDGRRQQGAGQLLLVERVPPHRLGAGDAVQPRHRCERRRGLDRGAAEHAVQRPLDALHRRASPSTTGSNA